MIQYRKLAASAVTAASLLIATTVSNLAIADTTTGNNTNRELAAEQLSVNQLNDRILDATKAIAERDYATACGELSVLPQDRHPTKPQLSFNLWFLQGQCYAGLGLYEEAREYFQKVVDADPKAARPKLDLAMVEQYLGNYSAANRQYEQLLELPELDDATRDKVERLYDQRPDALRYYIELKAGIVNDSNVNYGPDSDVVNIYDIDLELNSQARPISSSGTRMGLQLSAEKLLGRFSRLSASLSMDQTTYSEDSDFDTTVMEAKMSYRQKWWFGEYMVQPRWVAVQLGSANLFNVMTLEGAYAWVQTDNLRLTGMGGFKTYSYSQDNERDTTELGGQFLANYRAGGRLLLNGRLGYSQGSASVDAYSYSDILFAMGADYALAPTMMLSVNFESSQTDYAGELEAFNTTRSDTRTRFATELTYNLQNLSKWLNRFSVDLGMRNYANFSNVELYENSRNQTYVTLRGTF